MSMSALRRFSSSIIPSASVYKTRTSALFCTPTFNAVVKREVKPYTLVRMFSTGPTPDSVKEPEQQLTFKEKVKHMWKNYGKLAIVTYTGVYVSTLGLMFLALDFGAFNASTFGFDHAAAIAKFCDVVETVTGTTTLPAYIKDHPAVGTFAVGWVMTKFTEPLRLATTVMVVPSIARYWNKITASKAEEKAHKDL